MLNIPSLQRNIPITRDDFPSDQYHLWWQNVVKALTDTITAQQQQIEDIQTALDSATNGKRATARINSYTSPTSVLSAVDAGSNAKIVIAAHTRVYPSAADLAIPSVSIAAAEITGLAYSTAYYVYYDDPTLSSTTPAFQTTTVPATAQVGAGNARHFVGVVTTPASGGTGTTGGGGSPPGGGGGPLP